MMRTTNPWSLRPTRDFTTRWHLLVFAALISSVFASNNSHSTSRNFIDSVGRIAVEPAKAIQNVLEEGHEFLETHIEWVVGLSHDVLHTNHPSPTKSSTAAQKHQQGAHITSAPLLCNRAAFPQPQAVDCNAQINAAKSDASRVLSATVSNLQRESSQAVGQAQAAESQAKAAQSTAQMNADMANAAASAAQSSLLSIQTSASIALTSASSSVMMATSSLSSVISSASSAVASATASANAAVLAAQMSASSAISIAVQSASQSIAIAQMSAASVVSDAKATATFALQQAKETISSAAIQAAASVRASQVTAVTATQAAIAIVVSVIGSSLLSILGYFLLVRYRRRRAEREGPRSPVYNYSSGADGKRRNSDSDVPRNEPRNSSMPETQMRRSAPVGWRRTQTATEYPLPGREDRSRKLQYSFGSTALETEPEVEQYQAPRSARTPRSGRPTLIYDPENPTRPPTFGSRLTESLTNISPFGSFRLSKVGVEKMKDPEQEAGDRDNRNDNDESGNNGEKGEGQQNPPKRGSWIGTAI